MSLKRRQFLVLGGAVGGCSLALLVNRIIASSTEQQPVTSQTSQAQPPSPVSEATPTPVSQNVPGSEGLFNPPRGDARIVVISDLNSQYGSTDYEPEVDKAISLIPFWAPNLVLCGGDMIAGQDASLPRAQVEAMWSAFDQHVAAPLRNANIPYGFTLGNHDASGAIASDGTLLYQQDRDIAAAYWNNPSHDPGVEFVDRAGFPFYYTFQQNGVFFLTWDASSATIPAEQLAWAEQALESEAAKAAKLRIAIGHLPLYGISVGRDEPGEYLSGAEELRALMERHNVHTYVSGHNHAYYPGHRGQLELLYSGLLGSGARRLLNGNLAPQKTLTVVDVGLDSQETIYTTYDMRTMELVDMQQLPRLIASPTGQVLRRDVNEANLTAEERSLQYTPSS
ncbi:metallophosphoesterase [Oculatella sp. FACHB-28]|uniref:metallophosphoesterase family protein n=1 Tax=Cyanophyceae TaxID=3028117 RepID=UPI0016821D38|nr:metallophosphoesterase [Leptolyngbya sp. FACHB-671]MBD1869149.1 metallophosphoesterase [Cyanobacteria bacterium FACHB-471]MBD2055412.1 metallophosphoesterase [Oculatella sp. FACHB-28]MBD2067551.1 metallophosphoesterase [Leptolyngbya sp. FACHB-671]